MAREVYPTPEFKAMSKYFVFVEIDGDKQPAVKDAYGVSGYPTFHFTYADGKSFKEQVGYQPKDQFLKTMDAARIAGGK